ncbi:hypothetical protein [Tardiphaga sp.]|jgi:capsular polysaccharide transport system permease protein|uniref:hypothetical protein n=1 Tax=Tardiphaga sp. TaxID=1926292 RepID=UPI0037DA2837
MPELAKVDSSTAVTLGQPAVIPVKVWPDSTVPERTASGEVVPSWRNDGLLYPARRARRSPLLASLLVVVIIPTILASIYLLLIASPRYTSEFRVAIRSVDLTKSGGMSAMMGLSGIPGASQAANDSQAIVQYLQSHDAIVDLEKRVPLRRFFQDGEIDRFSRLADGEPMERVLKYWRSMLNAYYETSTGTIVVMVTAFSPKDAATIADHLRMLSERLVNNMSERMRVDTVSVAQQEVDRSEKRLQDAIELTRKTQDKFNVIDPKQAADSTLSLAAKLQDEIVRLKAEIDVQAAYLSSTSPTMKIRSEQLQSLQTQLDALRSQVTATGSGNKGQSLSTVISKFSNLQSEQMFAERSYQSALTSLDSARTEAARQQLYLQTIVTPSMPEQQSFPRPLLNIAEVAGVAFTLWAIIIFVVHGVREHL